MKTFAYCCASFSASATKAAGVVPITCPPVTAAIFQPIWLEAHQFVYFDLHGEAGQPYWAGDNGLFALAAETIRQADLGGATVFAANCHLTDADHPMLAALLAANAGAVIGGAGVNYSGKETTFGASLLGMWVRRMLSFGCTPEEALRLAKRRIQAALLSAAVLDDKERETVNRDTLAFSLYTDDRAGLV